MDFSKYKFRSSALSQLMVKSRSKSDPLSQTTKTYLKELWIREIYGRDKDYQTINKFTQKGTMVESDSLDLFQEVSGEKYFKNVEQLENDFITGKPDIIKPLIDIKSSWDLWTFANVDEKYVKKEHYHQVLGYGWLTGQATGEIVYALVDTPEMLINDEMYRLSFKISEEEAESYKNNFIFKDIPVKDRIKRFKFEVLKDDIEELKTKIILCRDYMKGLTL